MVGVRLVIEDGGAGSEEDAANYNFRALQHSSQQKKVWKFRPCKMATNHEVVSSNLIGQAG